MSISPETTGRELHTTDLVTGERVLNFLPIAEDKAVYHRINAMMDDAQRELKEVSKVDLTAVFGACDCAIPGFSSLFSEQQIEQLTSASADLLDEIYIQYDRLLLGEQTEYAIADMDDIFESNPRHAFDDIQNAKIRRKIADVIDLWKKNKDNPHRNYFHRTYRSHDVENQRACGRQLLINSPGLFSIAISSDIDHVGAWARAQCMLALSEDEMSSGIILFMTVMHEMVHARQYIDYLLGGSDCDSQALDERHREYGRALPSCGIACILPNECEAYAVESEIISASASTMGNDIEKLIGYLHISGNQKNHYRTLFELSQRHSREAQSLGRLYSPGFEADLEHYLRRDGHQIFQLSEDGIPILKAEKTTPQTVSCGRGSGRKSSRTTKDKRRDKKRKRMGKKKNRRK